MSEDNVIHINYEAENEMLKEQIKANSEFYNQVIQEKNNEIKWLKKTISGILHI